MGLPEPGSQWRAEAETFVVRAVNAKRVLMVCQEDGRTMEVPAWNWPGLFTPESGEMDGETSLIQAALVGGDAGIHYDRCVGQAMDLGIQILYHYPGTSLRAPPRLPSEVMLVIFLTSHISHNFYGVMKDLAKRAGKPVVHATSQGFRVGLEAEIRKIGVRFGGNEGGGSFVYYEWDGTSYTAKEFTRRSDGLFASILLVATGLFAMVFGGRQR